MMSAAIGKLSSGYIYSLALTARGSALSTHALLAAHGTRDNREKFVKTSPERVKVEDSKDAKIAREILAAQRRERSVIRHEEAHMQAGGQYAGAASYIYQKGVDGKGYIVGGEVTMQVPAGGDLERLKAALERVKRAAMAPADPSPQDMQTAAMASARQAAVNQEITRKKALERYEKDKLEHASRVEAAAVEPFRRFKFRELTSFELAI